MGKCAQWINLVDRIHLWMYLMGVDNQQSIAFLWDMVGKA